MPVRAARGELPAGFMRFSPDSRPDPLRAALDTLSHAAVTWGSAYPRLFAEVPARPVPPYPHAWAPVRRPRPAPAPTAPP